MLLGQANKKMAYPIGIAGSLLYHQRRDHSLQQNGMVVLTGICEGRLVILKNNGGGTFFDSQPNMCSLL